MTHRGGRAAAVALALALAWLAAPSVTRADELWSPAIEARFRGLCTDAPTTFTNVPLDGYALRCRHLAANREWYAVRFLRGSYQRIADAVRREVGTVRTVFYPFGGPDLATPFAVFPDAEVVTAVALEAVGTPASFAADPHEKSVVFPERAEELTEPSSVRLALSALLSFYGVGYFTVEDPFPSIPVSHVVLLQAIHDLHGTIESVRAVEPGADGTVRAAGAGAPGLEVRFRTPDAKRRTYRYFTANLGNASFPLDGALARLVASQKPDGVLVKAGSNLIVEPGFTTVRALVMGNARAIVEDGELAGESGDARAVSGFRHVAVPLDGLGIGYAQHAAVNQADLWVRDAASGAARGSGS
ncbi:MAG: hypothetical protein IPK07_03905 [Deltaproteobacteria bacterium]|nr:hypothetical protein [Deltaproteobacteria bacterium]